MNFETTSLLLNWMEMGALLAILFRLSYTFDLIANTQRELRRAIHHLGERRADKLGVSNAFAEPPGAALIARSAALKSVERGSCSRPRSLAPVFRPQFDLALVGPDRLAGFGGLLLSSE